MAEAIKMGGGISIPSKEKFYINKNIDESIKVGDPIQFTGDYIEKTKPVYGGNDSTVFGLYKLSDHKYFYLHVIGSYNYPYGCIMNTNSDNTDFNWGNSYPTQTKLSFYGGFWTTVEVLSSNLMIIVSKNDSNVLQISIIRISTDDTITETSINVTQTLSNVSFVDSICIPVKINSNSFYLIYTDKSTHKSLYVRKITVNDNNTLTYGTIKNLTTNQLLLNQFTIYNVVDNIVALSTNLSDNGKHYAGIIQLDLSNINNSTLSNQVKINTVDNAVYSAQIYDILLSPTKNTLFIRGYQYVGTSSSRTNIYLIKLDISNKTSISIDIQKLFDTNKDCGELLKVFNDNSLITIIGTGSGNLGNKCFSYIFITKNNKIHMNEKAVNISNTNANTATTSTEYFCEMPAEANRGVVFISLCRVASGGDYSTYADIAESFTIKAMEDSFDGVALTPGMSGKQIKVLI